MAAVTSGENHLYVEPTWNTTYTLSYLSRSWLQRLTGDVSSKNITNSGASLLRGV